MEIKDLEKQNERIEGFKEGYQAALNWIAMKLQTEKEMSKAEAAKEVKENAPATSQG